MSEVRMMKFREGTVVLKEGEGSGVMYKILKGHAELYLGYGTERETLVGIIGEQKCFGEFSLLLKKPSIYTVVAYSELHVMKIDQGSIGDFIRSNPKNIMGLMTNMANTIMLMRKQMELLQEELEEIYTTSKAKEEMEQKIRSAKYIMRQYAVQQSFKKPIE